MGAFTTWLTGLTSKTTPVAADELYLRDSEDAGASKKLTWANLKAAAGAPGGSTTQVQYNNAGAFGGAAGITVAVSGNELDFSANTSAQNVASMKIGGQYGDLYVGAYAGTMIIATGANLGSSANARIGPSDITLTSVGGVGFAATTTGALGTGSEVRFTRASATAMGVRDATTNARDLSLRNLIGTGNLATGIAAKTADYTMTANDGTIEVDASGAARTITLPAVASTGGRIYVIKKTDSSGNAVTVDANASETIDGATTVSLASQYSTIIIQANTAGTAWLKLAGI